MSKIALTPNASGTGTLTVAAPNTNSDYTLTLPAETGTVLTSGGAIDVNASAPADSLVIDSSGNVGIGTTSITPINNGKSSEVANLGNAGTTSDNQDFVIRSTYRYAALSIIGNNTKGSNIYFGDGDSNTIGSFQYDHTSNYLATYVNAAERMRIDASGNLLVGTTSTSPTSGVGTKILGGNVSVVNTGQDGFDFYNTTAGAYRFYVQANGTIAATNTTISAISDQRFKENIRDLDVGLAEIMQLRPRVFDWKEGKGKNTQNDRGFIAQEVEQVFPDLIDEWKDPAPEGEEPYKSVRQDLIPVLVKAIQELKAENDALKSRLDAVEALEARIAALEAGNVNS